MLNPLRFFRGMNIPGQEPSLPAKERPSLRPTAQPRIFISYRQSDSVAITGRIFDRLSVRYGSRSVFMDIDAIPFGSDFSRVLIDELRQCNVLFAIIGPKWFGHEKYGRSQIFNENDFVRMEIEAALQLAIPVIPILVDGAAMPTGRELPPSLSELTVRNAVTVRSGVDFHRDMDRLINAVEALLGRAAHEKPTLAQPAPDIDEADLIVNQVFVSHATTDRDWVERQVI